MPWRTISSKDIVDLGLGKRKHRRQEISVSPEDLGRGKRSHYKGNIYTHMCIRFNRDLGRSKRTLRELNIVAGAKERFDRERTWSDLAGAEERYLRIRSWPRRKIASSAKDLGRGQRCLRQENILSGAKERFVGQRSSWPEQKNDLSAKALTCIGKI